MNHLGKQKASNLYFKSRFFMEFKERLRLCVDLFLGLVLNPYPFDPTSLAGRSLNLYPTYAVSGTKQSLAKPCLLFAFRPNTGGGGCGWDPPSLGPPCLPPKSAFSLAKPFQANSSPSKLVHSSKLINFTLN